MSGRPGWDSRDEANLQQSPQPTSEHPGSMHKETHSQHPIVATGLVVGGSRELQYTCRAAASAGSADVPEEEGCSDPTELLAGGGHGYICPHTEQQGIPSLEPRDGGKNRLCRCRVTLTAVQERPQKLWTRSCLPGEAGLSSLPGHILEPGPQQEIRSPGLCALGDGEQPPLGFASRPQGLGPTQSLAHMAGGWQGHLPVASIPC